MITARQVIEAANRGDGCLGKCDPEEPVFVLRAQDALASDLVEKWAIWAQVGSTTVDKVTEAFFIVELMRRWPKHKHPD